MRDEGGFRQDVAGQGAPSARPQMPVSINGKFLGAPLNGVHRTAAHFAQGLLQRAAAAGHDTRLLAPRPHLPPPEFPELQPQVLPGRWGQGQGWEALTLPRAAGGRILVNLCNLAPLLHRNSVVMIHDAQTFLYPQDYSGRQAAAYRLILPMVARRARHILTVSEFAKGSLIAHGLGDAARISVVHNGTDHILAQPADPAILPRHGLLPGSYALCLGSAKGYKNLRRAFAAFAPPDPAPGGLRLVVAGGPGAAAYATRGWTPPPGALFTGPVSDAELRALYQGAAVFLFPSLTEGFGLPPVEAMHCGTPVIAARAGAMPEVCGTAAHLVAPDDTRAWRAAIAALAAPSDARSARIAAGLQRAAHLGWQQAGDRLWQILCDIQAGPSGGSDWFRGRFRAGSKTRAMQSDTRRNPTEEDRHHADHRD